MNTNTFSLTDLRGVHEWTKKASHDKNLDTSVMPSSDWADNLFPTSLSTYPLPAVDYEDLQKNGRDSLATLQNRQSTRLYAPEPMPQQLFANFLKLGCIYHQTPPVASYTQMHFWRNQTPSCRLLPLVLNVADLQKAAYLYDEKQHLLRFIKSDGLQEMVDYCIFQAEFLEASALIAIIGSPGYNLAQYGDRGYRYMLLDVGIMLQRLYFAASTLDLAGCTSGSLFQNMLDNWLGLDGRMETSLMLFAVGQKVR